MLKQQTPTLQQKIAVIETVMDILAAVMVIDNHPGDFEEAIPEALAKILTYPDLAQIKAYPLGRILADYKAVEIQKNLCLFKFFVNCVC